MSVLLYSRNAIKGLGEVFARPYVSLCLCVFVSLCLCVFVQPARWLWPPRPR